MTIITMVRNIIDLLEARQTENCFSTSKCTYYICPQLKKDDNLTSYASIFIRILYSL